MLLIRLFIAQAATFGCQTPGCPFHLQNPSGSRDMIGLLPSQHFDKCSFLQFWSCSRVPVANTLKKEEAACQVLLKDRQKDQIISFHQLQLPCHLFPQKSVSKMLFSWVFALGTFPWVSTPFFAYSLACTTPLTPGTRVGVNSSYI